MVSGGGLSGRTFFVTGASGFIGSWLADRLLAEGARVVVPLRPGGSEPSWLEGRCSIVDCDLADPESLVRVLNERDVDTIFHLAAQAIIGAANTDPRETFRANAEATYNVCEAARLLGGGDGGPRVIAASSYNVYGGQHDCDESSALRPRNPYEASKACADLLARCYAASYAMPVAVSRFANVYGPADPHLSRLIPGTMRSLAAGEAPVILSDGTPEREFLFVGDAVDAYLAIADSLGEPEHHGRAWNAGPGEAHPIREVVASAVAVSGKQLEPDVRGEPRAGASPDRQTLDSGAIRNELGWSPATPLEEGLERTWRWYAEHPEIEGSPGG